jgi:biopolymer transport protein ExbB
MDFTIIQMWSSMGVVAKTVVAILFLMSVFVVWVSTERWYVFMKARKHSREYAVRIQDMLKQRRYKEAVDAAANYKYSHIAKIISSGLTEYLKASLLASSSGAGYDVLGAVNRAIEKSSGRESANLRRGLAGLASVGSTAPFVGLFGTVFGIIKSFQGMARNESGGIGAVSAGIAEALVTTAVGIGVAIVAVLLYNYFTSKIESLQVDVDEISLEMIDMLGKQNPEPVNSSQKLAVEG